MLLRFAARRSCVLSQGLRRALWTVDPTVISPVDLQFERHDPPSDVTPSSASSENNDRPLVIIHGLFGSKRNWVAITKGFASQLRRPVYALDLRNHGNSPHASPMTYPAMAEDLIHFCKTQGLEEISLMGHSMGGKAAMALALSPSLPKNLLRDLIVVDIAPQAMPALTPQFISYIKAMQKIEESGVQTRKEAEKILLGFEQSPRIRAFLLTNFIPADSKSSKAHFRIPLSILYDSIGPLGDFPFKVGKFKWEGRTLFIKGQTSNYLNKNNLPFLKDFFPQMVIETLNTGHWVHADDPRGFMNLVNTFLNGGKLPGTGFCR